MGAASCSSSTFHLHGRGCDVCLLVWPQRLLGRSSGQGFVLLLQCWWAVAVGMPRKLVCELRTRLQPWVWPQRGSAASRVPCVCGCDRNACLPRCAGGVCGLPKQRFS